MSDPGEGAASTARGEGAEAASAAFGETSHDGDASAPIQLEAQDMGRITNSVTDISAVAAYAARIGATLRSIRKLAVIEKRGRYIVTLAEVRVATSGEISAPEGYETTPEEVATINAAWPRYTWPKYNPFLFTVRDLPTADPRLP